MKHFKNNIWTQVPRPIRRLLIFIIGWLVVIAGVAMLALPGPGWAAIFLGFAILATEFASAKQIRDWMVAKLKAIINWLRRLLHEVTTKK